MEVNSTQDKLQVDLIHLMLQAASIIQFVNTNLNVYNEKRDFIFVAIYINKKEKVKCYPLYQKDEDTTGNCI